jgi:hypothetical protein
VRARYAARIARDLGRAPRRAQTVATAGAANGSGRRAPAVSAASADDVRS